jgi:hypothetical protein
MAALVSIGPARAATVIAKGSIQVTDLMPYPSAEVAAYVAGGCPGSAKDGYQEAIVDLKGHIGEQILVTENGADVQNQSRAVVIGALPDCSLTGYAGNFLLGEASPGKPFRWTVTRRYLVIGNGHSTNVGEHYTVVTA